MDTRLNVSTSSRSKAVPYNNNTSNMASSQKFDYFGNNKTYSNSSINITETPTVNLFDKRLPSAIKITDIAQAKKLFESKIREGFRWITPGFIYTSYEVGETDKKITSPEELNGYDVLFNNSAHRDEYGNIWPEIYYLEEHTGKLCYSYVRGVGFTSVTMKQFLDENYGNNFFIEKHEDKDLFKAITPAIAKARQMPRFKEGDWVVMEGKTMRLESKKSEVIKITDVEQAKELIKDKIKKGFRWIKPGFNNDDLPNIEEYTGYRVGETDKSKLSLEDLKGYDVLVQNEKSKTCKIIYYQDHITNNVRHKAISANSTEEIKKVLDENYGNWFQIKAADSLTQALQMPDFNEGEWLVIEGKTMCIKKDPPFQIIEITDVEQGKKLIEDKIKEDFLWVTGYQVGETDKEITSPKELNGYDVLFHTKKNSVTTYTNIYYLKTNTDKLVHTKQLEGKFTTESLKQFLNEDYETIRLNIKMANPEGYARQIPKLEEGDWIVLEGKKMCLVKASEQKFQSLEDDLAESMSRLDLNRTDTTVSKLPGVRLPKELFHDSYARMAGAYIRRLERYPHLNQVFHRFFQVEEFDSEKKHPEINSISAFLHDKGQERKLYTRFYEVTLKLDPLTEEDLELIHKALGVTIGSKNLNRTIVNTVPFKKVLEVLTYYNPESGIPMLVSLRPLKWGNEDVKFLLSPNEPSSQLLVSVQTGDDKNGNLTFTGNAYPWWVNYGPVSAQKADLILNCPLSNIAGLISYKMLEFLACTQIVESHFTPGKLESSRVPGSGKLARAIIDRHVISKADSLASSFAVGKKTPFPMAASGGTGNTRRAVNSLRRDGGNENRNDSNTYAYDMSDDSDLE